MNEGEILSLLDHPNIVKLHKIVIWEDKSCLILELCPQKSLLDHMKLQSGKRITERKAKIIIIQIQDALLEIHDKKIAHMDLKLENIQYNPDNEEIKIIDFGFSLQEDSKFNLTNYIAGTPPYMAPEMISSDEMDPYSLDIWALGVITFKLVTGLYPYRGKSEKEIFAKIKKGGFIFPDTIKLTQNCKDFIKFLLTPNFHNRPNGEEAIQHTWLGST